MATGALYCSATYAQQPLMPPTLDDYHWLVSPAAAALLTDAAATLARDGLVATATRLRKILPPARGQLVLQQCELRQRASEKFSQAARLFFSDVGLQQSSSETLAHYKAKRFPRDALVVDLCCGIGGDLLSLGERGSVMGIERDATIALLAAANSVAAGLSNAIVRCADATTVDLDQASLVHIDPDRRASGRRTIRVEDHQPSDEFLAALMSRCAGGAIKLAPACEVPQAWRERCELEWISEQGECKQLVAWFGTLAESPSQCAATALKRTAAPATFSPDGVDDSRAEVAASLGRFVFEPDAAVIAARLVDALAARNELRRVDAHVAYLTGDRHVDDPLLTSLEVIEAMPFDLKRLKAALRAGGFGRLEVKKRGVDASPEELRRKLKVDGENRATLLLTPHAGRTMAVIARRTM